MSLILDLTASLGSMVKENHVQLWQNVVILNRTCVQQTVCGRYFIQTSNQADKPECKGTHGGWATPCYVMECK